MASVFMKRRNWEIHACVRAYTHTRQAKMKAKFEAMPLQAREHRRLLATTRRERRGLDQASSQPSQGPWWHLSLRLPGFRAVRQYVLSLKTLSFWHFTTGAPANTAPHSTPAVKLGLWELPCSGSPRPPGLLSSFALSAPKCPGSSNAFLHL